MEVLITIPAHIYNQILPSFIIEHNLAGVTIRQGSAIVSMILKNTLDNVLVP